MWSCDKQEGLNWQTTGCTSCHCACVFKTLSIHLNLSEPVCHHCAMLMFFFLFFVGGGLLSVVFFSFLSVRKCAVFVTVDCGCCAVEVASEPEWKTPTQ